MIVAINTVDSSMWRRLADELATRPGVSDVRLMPSASDRVGVEGLVAFSLSAVDLETWPDLRAVAVPMAGLNSFDLAALNARGIGIAPAHANGPYVAERALALMLAFFGRIVPWHNDFASGRWHGFAAGEPVAESWASLRGTRVAILGTGSIGVALARLLQPFGCQCVGYRRRAGAEGLPEGVFHAVETDLLHAVRGASTVVITLPLTEETRGMIGREALNAMSGALLVNVGRGPVIDEEELIAALDAGQIAGAALDTWWRYPDGDAVVDTQSLRLAGRRNVLLSPHVGGYTPQATEASAREAVAAIARLASTGSLPGAATLSEGY